MTYKVMEKTTVADGFKTKEDAEDWASMNLLEDEDRTWAVVKE